MHGSERRAYSLACALLCAALGAVPARAERFERILGGPELRVRAPAEAGGPLRYELALPHGLSAAHGELVARLGFVIPSHDGALAFPLTVGLRYLPFDSWLRPLLGADLGGYFAWSKGPRTTGAPGGVMWLWSARVLLGAELRLGSVASLRLYGDAMVTELSPALWARADTRGGFGGGAELVFRLSPPRWRMVKMVTTGEEAPEGW
jgi:hypothetical protein